MASADPTWRRSTISENGPDCVEIHNTRDALRDSKTTDPTLHGNVRPPIHTTRNGTLSRE